MMKTKKRYAIAPISSDSGSIIKGKKYPIVNETNEYFLIPERFTEKKIMKLLCLKKRCAHINNLDWTLVTEINTIT